MKKNERINENKKEENKNAKFDKNSPLRKINPTKHPCHDRKPYTKKDEIPTKKRGQLIKEIKTAKKQHQQPKLTIYENSALQNVLAAVPKKEKYQRKRKKQTKIIKKEKKHQRAIAKTYHLRSPRLENLQK